jgi:hypothetical protein
MAVILRRQLLETLMTLCPIAIAVGCKKCPAFSVCPLKDVIGDNAKPAAPEAPKDAAKKDNK